MEIEISDSYSQEFTVFFEGQGYRIHRVEKIDFDGDSGCSITIELVKVGVESPNSQQETVHGQSLTDIASDSARLFAQSLQGAIGQRTPYRAPFGREW